MTSDDFKRRSEQSTAFGRASKVEKELREKMREVSDKLLAEEHPTFGTGEMLELTLVQIAAGYHIIGVSNAIHRLGGMRSDAFAKIVSEGGKAMAMAFSMSLCSYVNNCFEMRMSKDEIVEAVKALLAGEVERAAQSVADGTKETLEKEARTVAAPTAVQ